MKKSFTLFILLFSIIIWGQKASDNSYFFYENKGQIVDQNGKSNPNVKYLFNSNGLNVQLRNNGFSYDVYELEKIDNETIKQSNNFRNTGFGKDDKKISYKRKNHRVDIDLIQSNPNIEVVAEGASTDYENFYNIPNKPEGVTNVKRYKKVTYKNVYPNVDLVFFKPSDTSKVIEYNFIVNPGGKVSDIKIKFSGAKTNLNSGKISMNLRFGEMQENIPLSWTENSSTKKNISVQYKDLGNNTYGFNSPVNSSSDKIIIDPVPTRIWGSYLGGPGEESADITIDSDNNIYIFGWTQSTSNMATIGAYQTVFAGAMDAYINKVTKDGKRLWGTYYGKKYGDGATALDVDDNKNIYVSVDTDTPMPGRDSPFYVYKSIALLKFTPNGALTFEKTFTGNGTVNQSISLMYHNNSVYISGQTNSTSGLATSNAYMPNKPAGPYAGFIGKFSATNGSPDWLTYFGGDQATNLNKIFGYNGGIELFGATRATDIPLVKPFQNQNNGDSDGLYLKFSDAGNLLQSSYFGKAGFEYYMNARRFGDVVIFTGRSESITAEVRVFTVNTETQTILDYQTTPVYGWPQVYTYIDKVGNIFVSGHSDGIMGPNNPITTPNAYMTATGPYIKAYYIKYNSNLIKQWGTFYGGDGGTQLPMITKDNEDYLYFWGLSSRNFTGIATPGTFQQTTDPISNDWYIAKFVDCESKVSSTSNTYCPGSTIQLHAEGGTTYAWTGPNGFKSSLQDPIISDATAAMSGTYQCVVTGSGDCDGTFTVEVKVEDITKPVPDKATLPIIKGKCSVTATDTPTATDECAGSIVGTTTDPLTYSVPGTYTIHWVYEDPSKNKEYQNQTVIVEEEDLPTLTSIPVFCINEGKKISDLRSYITGSNLKFYDSSNTLITDESALLQSGKYFVTQTSTCESPKAEINITVNQTNKPILSEPAEFCPTQNAKLSDIKIDGKNLTWYDASGVILPNNTLVQDGVTYYVSQTLNSCESEKLDVPVTFTMNAVLANSYSTKICNDKYGNTKDNFDLKQFESNIDPGSHGYHFEYFDKNNLPISNIQTLHLGLNEYKVKVSLDTGCFKIVDLDITLNEKPNAKLPSKDEFCKGSSKILEVENRPDWTYLWSTGEITSSISITTAGTYSVKITNTDGCTDEQSIVVSYTKMTNIQKVEVNNSTATVVLDDKSSDYIFSLDEITWQSSPTFNNLSNGSYIASVKTKTGCVVGQMPFTIFKIANAFSPNGDGINDTWTIGGLENYPGSRVQIFDRYGKKVFEQIVNGIFSWNGHSEGRPLPTATYYYIINISDGRVLNGSLLLKNRN